MTTPKRSYSESQFRSECAHKVSAVITGRLTLDRLESWLDLVVVAGAPLLLSRRAGIIAACQILALAMRKGGGRV